MDTDTGVYRQHLPYHRGIDPVEPASRQDRHPFRKRRRGQRLEQQGFYGFRNSGDYDGSRAYFVFATTNDPKKRNIDEKLMRLILWIIPVLSLIVNFSCYAIALGKKVDIGMITNVCVGIVFIIMGNYMHRIKQNYTVGIKLPWTLNSEENWNRTHRMASWLFVLCGILFIINGAVLQTEWMVGAAILMAVVPGLYSFILYKKGI